MTWIRDDNGTRWVEPTERKRRAPARALRFAEIKVGDQLEKTWDRYVDNGHSVWHYVVTDLWFDPVAGQDNETSGRMVAIRSIDPRTGEPRRRKEPHTIRGLASQGFTYSKIDFIAHAKARNEAMIEGSVVGIGKGRIIRARPKLPGSTF